jgi:LuxR family maltose regulon positive regulatory protein
MEAIGNDFARHSTGYLMGEISLGQGNLYKAEQVFQELFDKSFKNPRHRAHALIGLGKIAFERNDVDVAEQRVTEAYDIAEKVGDKHILADAAILLARVKQARGETESASQLLRSLATRVGIPLLVRELRSWEAWLALVSGDITTAQGWYATTVQNSDGVFTLQQEREALIAARLLLAQGEAETSLHLLDHWQHSAHTGQRGRSELEILILKALAYFVEKRLPQAKATIIQALQFAYKAGYIRLFLQEGEAMTALLKEVAVGEDQALSIYVHTLLRGFALEQTRNEVASRLALMPVADELSPQEHRVFLLIADGQSNPEIADELGVSINTIKTQVKSIYSKLNLNNRKQAREMARALNLL